MSGGVFTAQRSSGFYLRLLLGLFGFGILLLFFRGPRVIHLDAATYDPAIETELQARSADYGGVDRWTFPGMEAGLLVERLKASGYDCPAVQDPKLGGAPKPGTHEQTCTRLRGFPLARQLIVQADVNFAHGDRVSGIKAYSVDASRNAFMQRYARLLRALGLIEPAEMKVQGLSFTTSAELARHVVDTVNPNGWRSLCDRVTLEYNCRQMAVSRRKQGFPASNAEPVAVTLIGLMQSLDSIGLRPLILTLAIGGEALPKHSMDDPLPIRVEGEALWLDLLGNDFAGAPRRVSVQFAAQGATPLNLTIRQADSAPETVALKGIPRKTGMDDPYWLLPEAAVGDGRSREAQWLAIPRPDDSRGLERLAERLAVIDAAYIPSLVQGLIARATEPRPEEFLNLYSPLQRVDRLAQVLRRTRIPQFTPAGSPSRSIGAFFPDDPGMRAAWALARCESNRFGAAVIEPQCWRETTAGDVAVVALLRGEVTRLKSIYAGLAPAHQILTRLGRLDKILSGDIQ